MRCKCCNVILTPFESTIRSAQDNEFIDMCSECLSYIEDDVNVLVREDLRDVGTDIAIYDDYIDIEGDNYNML